MPEAKVKTFLFEYICKGHKYVLELPAYTQKEALDRFECISSGEYLGEREGVVLFDDRLCQLAGEMADALQHYHSDSPSVMAGAALNAFAKLRMEIK